MLAFLQYFRSPSWKFVDARDSTIVAGHSELPVTFVPAPIFSPSAAAPNATIVMPHFDM